MAAIHGYLRCRIEGRNIIVGNTIIGKTPPENTDKYDEIITDNFEMIDINKKYVLAEWVPSTTHDDLF